MYEIGINGLQKLLMEGRRAAKYAWDHYEELTAREHVYTLYGPHANAIGASIPSSLTPVRARNLTCHTRRKDYLIYHLDSDYNVMRTITVLDYTKVDCTYHHFQLDGVTYAYPFRGTEKVMYTDRVKSLRFSNGKPVYFGLLQKNFVFAQFYEYETSEKMMVSTYRYSPLAQFSMYGYAIDPNAPVGALNSCVDRHCKEEISHYIDFAQWFK